MVLAFSYMPFCKEWKTMYGTSYPVLNQFRLEYFVTATTCDVSISASNCLQNLSQAWCVPLEFLITFGSFAAPVLPVFSVFDVTPSSTRQF